MKSLFICEISPIGGKSFSFWFENKKKFNCGKLFRSKRVGSLLYENEMPAWENTPSTNFLCLFPRDSCFWLTIHKVKSGCWIRLRIPRSPLVSLMLLWALLCMAGGTLIMRSPLCTEKANTLRRVALKADKIRIPFQRIIPGMIHLKFKSNQWWMRVTVDVRWHGMAWHVV